MRLPRRLVASFALVLLCVSSAGAQQEVVWTRMVNATASGHTLQKIAGCDGCEDSGGISTQQIARGTGGVQFVPGVGPGQQVYAGLSHTITTPLNYTQLDHAFAVYGSISSYACEIRERGVWKADCTFVAGDVLRISIEAGPVVRYYRNGATVYASAAVPADYPYVLGADLFNVGTSIGNAAIMMPSLTNWTSLDVGVVGLAGDASYRDDVLTVQGAGAGIGGTTDAFHFVYQALSGDGALVTRVNDMSGTNPSAMAGVMMRDGLTPDAAYVMVGLTPAGGLAFTRRAAPGTATTSVQAGTRPLPGWIKLVRFGHTIAAYSSSDGSTWAAVGSTAEAMGATLDVGIAVTSHDPTQLNAAAFESLSLEVKGVASTYLALTDRAVYPKPALPTLGPAGWHFVDPTFRSRMLRVTDAHTRPGYQGRSLTAPSAAHQLAWNASSDRFYIRSIDGTIIPYAFDASTMTASRIAPSLMENGGLTILSQVEPQFSFLSPNLLFGSRQDPINDWPIIRQYDFDTQTYADISNLGAVTSISPGTYAGALSSSATTPEKLSVLFGGVQDTNYKVAVFQISPAGAGAVILDTRASTITTNGATASTNIPLGVFLHHAWMEQSGRYVVLYTVNQQPVPYYVWDLDTNIITGVSTNAGGHDATGFRWQINQACCTTTTSDAAQWQSRELGNPAATADLINPVLTPEAIYLADHTSWNNAQPGTLMPILSSLYRYFTGGANTTPWRAWDDEIVAIETGAAHGGTVWRFAHHRSDVSYDDDPSRLYFWYQPIAVISPNGRWALFTSNWEKSLGAAVDSDRQPGGMFRTDVFMVELAQAASAGPTTPPITIEVGRATPVLTWANPAAITYGTALSGTQLNATASVPETFVYNPAAGTVLGAGTHTLSTTCTPTDTANYTTATASVTLEVGKATPVLTWATPTAITYGTALSATQLNATANVAGTYAYTPAAGTVLDAGTHTLSTTCTPTDEANYTTATTTVGLEVTQSSSRWTEIRPLAEARSSHTATLLPDGRVIVTGGRVGTDTPVASAELYDARSGWTSTGSLSVGRWSHTATLLPNGQVLVVGGFNALYSGGAVSSVELYDPILGTWRKADSPSATRYSHTATLLSNGLVLVAGGRGGGISGLAIPRADLYDPASGWAETGRLNTARTEHTATLLPNGQVLVAGGERFDFTYATEAELYDPALGIWTATGGMGTARSSHTATLLPDGRVLVTGGWNAAGAAASAEVYDPATGTWTMTQALASGRFSHTATLRSDGQVLVAGGGFSEIYDPALGTWRGTAGLLSGRSAHTSTLLPNGQVLVVGGLGPSTLATAELCGPPAVTSIVPSRGPLSGGTTVTITGTHFVDGAIMTFGGTAATTVLVVDSTTITPTTPAHAAGTVDVGVTNLDGESATLGGAFTYGDPGLAWATPTPIAYGAALSGTQLNASAEAPGTFVYTPAAGTVLTAGTQTLSVTFTPTDAANYVPATTSVTLVVQPTVALTPTALSFGGTNTDGVLDPLTPSQPVAVLFGGGGTTAWMATADQSWVQVANVAADDTGAGSGTFVVSVVNPGNILAGVTTATATVTVTAPGAENSPQTVTVRLSLQQAGTTQPPFGLVDTPVQNAASLMGAVGFTGWVLDDVGVVRVRLYRNCLHFEPAINCQMVDGVNVVFLGDATIVAGARPDVEALYPDYPQAHRAGWGYAMLTNLLPHVPNGEVFGGQGSLTLYARARDLEGHEAWLGRDFLPGSQMQSNGVPTQITLANDTISKPFGTIDVPAQGETVTGRITTFGWVLTPDRNTTVGADDILMPLDGSSIWVWIDGVPQAPVIYNLCRGSAPGAVAAGTYCDDDVSSIFGNETPLPTYTPRVSNPTRHRNLDAGRGAIGAYVLDTTTLSNGGHTLVWGATDSAGRGEGIGSRYFSVLNAGADAARPVARRSAVRPTAVGDAVTPASERVRGRTGFDLNAPLVEVAADPTGVRHVRLPECGRLELRLGTVDAGYLVAKSERRNLPVGSHLDVETATFTWAPGVGFIGTYRLAFDGAGGTTLVDVTIRPVTSQAPGEAVVRVSLDLPQPGATVNGSLLVAGWALDPQADIGSGIGTVHVWAVRRDVPGAPVFLGAAALGIGRPDLAVTFGPNFGHAGFTLDGVGLAPAEYEVTAYVWNRRTGRWEDSRTVAVTVR